MSVDGSGPDRDERRSGSGSAEVLSLAWNVSGPKLVAFKGKR